VLAKVLNHALGAARTAARRRFDRLRRAIVRPELSVIVCSVDDRRFAQCRATWRERLGDRHYELIRIADARSLAEGYNRGLERSRAKLLVFCHDDIELLQPDVYERIVRQLSTADLVGVAGTSRLMDGRWDSAGQPDTHGQVVMRLPDSDRLTLDVFGFANQATGEPIQALDGVFLAVRRSVAEAVRFDSELFDGFHLYDLDFSFRAYLAGFRLAVCYDVLIYHHSLGDRGEAWDRYRVAFQEKFADQLSKAPPGTPGIFRFEVGDKPEALALFQRLSQKRIVAVPHA
jgi:hypothetical protein